MSEFEKIINALPDTHKHENALKMHIRNFLADHYSADSEFQEDILEVSENLIVGYPYWHNGQRYSHAVSFHWAKSEPLDQWFLKIIPELSEKLSLPL